MIHSISADSLISTKEYPIKSRPFVIGVAGGSASGKSEFCKQISEKLIDEFQLDPHSIIILNASSFYKSLTQGNIELAADGRYNFDHPFAFDVDLMSLTLKSLAIGRKTELYEYNFNTFQQDSIGIIESCPSVILIEGILVLYFEELRNLFSMKVFLDVDSDTRLSQAVIRDTMSNSRRLKPIDLVLDEWLNHVKPSFEDYVLPSKKYADVVVPRGIDNIVAIDLIVQHIFDLWRSGHVGIRKKNAMYNSGSLDKTQEENSPSSPRLESFVFDNAESIYKPVPE